MIKKTLGKEAFVYGIGRVFGSSLSFLLLSFYSHSISIDDYGLIQILTAFIAFSNIILLFAFDASLMKHYVGESLENQKIYLSNTYFSLIITSAFFITILISFRTFFSTIIIGGNDPDWIIKIAFILFFDCLKSIHLLILRAENKAYSFISFLLLDIFLLTSLQIYLIGYAFDYNKVQGLIDAYFLSSIIIFILSFPIIFNRFDFKVLSIKAWRKIKKFAIPLAPAGVFWVILEFSDRKMLEFLIPTNSLEAVGTYGVGYKLGAIMLLIVYGFNYAWRPYFLKAKDESQFSNISNYVFYFLGFFWLLLVLFIGDIIALNIPFLNKPLISNQYLKGLDIIPLISLSYIFHASFILQEAGPFLKNKKTENISISRGIGVILNLILNLILIPYYHQFDKAYLGAAIATIISYFIMSCTIYLWNRSIFDFKYNWNIVGGIVLFMGTAWIISKYNIIELKAGLLILYILYYRYVDKA